MNVAKFIVLLLVAVQPCGGARQWQADVWQAGDTVRANVAVAEAQAFRPVPVPRDVLLRMKRKSLAEDSQVPVADLRYVRILHYTLQGAVLRGEMVVHRHIADDVADIFRQLYRARYPIECVRLIDDFDGDDERSMRANNTSGFCHRTVAGSKRLSKHALGMAVDLNPLYNPCFRTRRDSSGRVVGYYGLQPSTAAAYVDRTARFAYKIDSGDLAVCLFKAKGFRWGGDWRNTKDYQHFER